MLEGHEFAQGIYDYRKKFKKNPFKYVEEMLGIKLFRYQRWLINIMYKIKK